MVRGEVRLFVVGRGVTQTTGERVRPGEGPEWRGQRGCRLRDIARLAEEAAARAGAGGVRMDEATRLTVEGVLEYRFQDAAHLKRALTHASLVESRVESNERMEFLGDAILGLVVCEVIFQKFPGMLEGEMTKIKSLAVSRQTCAMVGKQMGLQKHLCIGKGMMNGAQPASLAAAALEAVIAAIYLDGGYEPARAFVRRWVEPLVAAAANSAHQQNFKSFLQQHAQQTGGKTPMYVVLDEQGPDHAKAFKVCVDLGGRRFGAAWGQSKKRAEQLAAVFALKELGAMSEEEARLALAQAETFGAGSAEDSAAGA